jgi:hypothetical protein
LGTTKTVVSQNAKDFVQEFQKYVVPKGQRHGKKNNDNLKEPALWPLIREVNIRCASAALSTGVVLVDLPGVADANAARNNIAKAYMRKVTFAI